MPLNHSTETSSKSKIARRGFLGGALAALGGVAGWQARKHRGAASSRPAAQGSETPRFEYDLSEFERTDPDLLLYRESHEFETGLARVKRLAIGLKGEVCVAGDREVRILTQEGALQNRIPLVRPPHAVEALDSGGYRILLANAFEVYDSDLKRIHRSPTFGGRTFFSSMASTSQFVYLADAGNREVVVCALDGEELDRFGKKEPRRNNPGFAVPSPYFDLSIDGDGKLRIANPGRLRVETYSLDGAFESCWGEAGMQMDRFCGCCNPVCFALTPGGRFITSEKGLTRIHVYSPQGEFQGVVAGPGQLVKDRAPARKAGQNREIGGGFDVAVNAGGSVLALDPFRKSVRRFEPIASYENAPTEHA